MSDLDRHRAAQEARRHAADLGHTTPYGEAIGRYLGSFGYDELIRPEPRPEPRRAVTPAPKRAGVVLAGVDESPASYVALDHAAIEADVRGWDLRVVHVQSGSGHDARNRGARLLEQMTDRVHAGSRSVAVTGRLIVGAPAAVLLADAGTADLVVVGRRHGTAGAAFGLTVGDRVAAQHTGPVLVVRVPGWPPGPDFAARPIVVGVDSSPASASAVAFAVSEARVRGCDVTLLHAASDPAAADRREIVDGVTVHHEVSGADPVSALIAASDRAAAVVVGRRGRAGVAGALLGSVSRSVVQHARCPVFLVS